MTASAHGATASGGGGRSAGRRRSRPLLATALAAVAALAAPPSSGAAQSGEGLDRVEVLVAEGRTATARQELQAWWSGPGARADRRDVQRALWLRAVLTVDAGEAVLDYQRLVIEYPGGPWSSRARVRLGRIAHAAGDLPGAAGHFRAVLRDHPESAERIDARRWLDAWGAEADRLAALRPAPAPPSAGVRPGADRAGTDGAGRTDADRGRADRADADRRGAEPDRRRPDAASPASAARSGRPEAAGRGPYAVQLGAFSTLERARALAEDVRGRGLDARVVRTGSGDLFRVRVGRFDDAEGATALYDRVRAMDLEAAVVADAHEERPAG